MYCHRLAETPAAAYPSAMVDAPIITGTRMPKRSDRRPIPMPAMPKPSMVSVYGSDAGPPATPNS